MKNTLFLPKTNFPMKPETRLMEKNVLKLWNNKLIQLISQRPNKFNLLDGPPYSNGNLHIGHALNKILKDIIVRHKCTNGYNAVLKPGWDCHGLPIESKVEENFNKSDIIQFRKECRKFAGKYINIQMKQFQKFGVFADWDNYYCTMSNKAEMNILKSAYKALTDGTMYNSIRPMLWSVVEKTTLADAEVEYINIKTESIYIKFEIKCDENIYNDQLRRYAIIWTTTPWTLPANQMIGYNKDIEYVQFKFINNDDVYICSQSSLEHLVSLKGNDYKLEYAKVFDIRSIISSINPITKSKTPALHAGFISEGKGTSIVHIAPSCGYDDFLLAKQHNIEVNKINMNYDSVFNDDVPVVAGHRVLDEQGKDGQANKIIVEYLKNNKLLFSTEKIDHLYPHSWRSKCKLIFTITNQWFIDIKVYVETILENINDLETYPKISKSRLLGMLKNRPDWCISRQRTWGVPLALFVHKDTNEPIRDDNLNTHMLNLFNEHGFDIWFTNSCEYFLHETQYNHNEYNKVMDVIEVWFDSGLAYEHAEMNPGEVDVMFEGSDQHRGWFQTAFLQSVINTGKINCKKLITHGFILDANGNKMSKSLGNVIDPLEVIEKYNTDTLRIWSASSKYFNDMNIGDNQINASVDKYRKIRNVFKYLISAADHSCDFVTQEQINEMDMLDQYILHRIYQTSVMADKAMESFKIHEYFKVIFEFLSNEISSLYCDIRKDSLYCDAIDSIKRKNTTLIFSIVLRFLIKYLYPITPYISEEAWQYVHYKSNSLSEDQKKLMISFLEQNNYQVVANYFNNNEIEKQFENVFLIRKEVLRRIENIRKEKKISSTLSISAILKGQEKCDNLNECIELKNPININHDILADILIISQCEYIFNKGYIGHITIELQILDMSLKCDRCWKYSQGNEIIEKNESQLNLCKRCLDIIRK